MRSKTWFAPYSYVVNGELAQANMDQWDGYPMQRQRLIDALSNVSNPVVLSGDWHCAAAMTLHEDPYDARTKKVGHNFAATSISSNCSWWGDVRASAEANDHVAHVNGARRGYLRCSVTRDAFTSDFRVVDDATVEASAVTTDVSIRTSDI